MADQAKQYQTQMGPLKKENMYHNQINKITLGKYSPP